MDCHPNECPFPFCGFRIDGVFKSFFISKTRLSAHTNSYHFDDYRYCPHGFGHHRNAIRSRAGIRNFCRCLDGSFGYIYRLYCYKKKPFGSFSNKNTLVYGWSVSRFSHGFGVFVRFAVNYSSGRFDDTHNASDSWHFKCFRIRYFNTFRMGISTSSSYPPSVKSYFL